MDCTNCELKQRQFFCENCLKTHIRDFRSQTQHFASDRQEQVLKAINALENITPARTRRANVYEYQTKVDEVMSALGKLRKENDKKRDKLRSLRESLAARRRTLSAAIMHPGHPTHSSHNAHAHAHAHATQRQVQEINTLALTLARARSGLVQELVEVFNIVEVGGRPPIGGKAGTKGEWTIGDLILPVPGDIRRYPPTHINAVITHTIHFLSLLTFYLGVKLPFEISWSGGKLGVGTPSIGAIRGSELGGWARWHSKQPLHLTSTPSPASPTTHDTGMKSPTIPMAIASQQSISDSYIESSPPQPQPQSSFTTALTMLIYNVTYLAYTQNVDVPLAQAGDVLSNLWSVCCSPDLGRKSHETAASMKLAPPTPQGFGIEFAQLLQATTANPGSSSRASRMGGGSGRRSSSGSGSGSGAGAEKRRSSGGRREERIVEEEEGEDGWDLVNESWD